MCKIENAAKDSNVHYVVMGTKGSTNSTDKEKRSVTTSMIHRLECPVLAVPEGAAFHSIEQIVFSIDFANFTKKTLDQLREFAAEFDAERVLLHVNTEAGYFNPVQWKNYKQTAQELLHYRKMHFEFFGEEDVMNTIYRYFQEKCWPFCRTAKRRKRKFINEATPSRYPPHGCAVIGLPRVRSPTGKLHKSYPGWTGL